MCQSGESTFAKRTGGGGTQGVLMVYEFKRTSFPKTGDRVWQKASFHNSSCIKKRVYIEGNPVDEEAFQDWDMWTTCYDMEEIIAIEYEDYDLQKNGECGRQQTCRLLPGRTGDVRSKLIPYVKRSRKKTGVPMKSFLLEK